MSLVAKIQGITRAQVWQLYKEHLSLGEIPKLKRARRKRKEISEYERKLVFEKYEKYKLGPLALESKFSHGQFSRKRGGSLKKSINCAVSSKNLVKYHI